MLALAILTLQTEEPVRTPAIYRCPAAEAESKFFEPLAEGDGYDAVCIEPKPGPSAHEVIRINRLKQFNAKSIDTAANLAWRNATIDFANGKISPKAWLSKAERSRATIHFLSNPKTTKLREATGQESSRAVFAEMILTSSPGRLCLTADDLGATRYLPGPGRYESWLLAMHDMLGPMLYLRHDHPEMVLGKPVILRADTTPGLLIFRQRAQTFYLNNGPKTIELPKLNLDKSSMIRGLDLEGPKPGLQPTGFLIEGTE